MTFAGFDRADCPDLSVMAKLKAETNLVWCGYYLHAPSQSAPTWRGKRAALVAQGWGLAPIYVGQETIGPGAHRVTAAQGAVDGKDAVAKMIGEGFPGGSWVYIDLENGPPFTAAQQAYVAAWIDNVEAAGFAAGVYCSFLFAAQVHALRPKARIWAFHVRTTAAHAVAGKAFPSPDPSSSGFSGAILWQRDDEARLGALAGLACDLDTAAIADPSAPDVVASVSAAPAIAKPVQPASAPLTLFARLVAWFGRVSAT